MSTASKDGAGLADVVAASSAICDVDGIEGRLVYDGYDVRDLAEYATFEETVYLLWHGQLPTPMQLGELCLQLSSNRHLPPEVVAMMHRFPRDAVPMEVLRSALSLLSMYDPDDQDTSPDANLRKAIRLIAQTPTIITTYQSIRAGRDPVAPRCDGSFAAAFLTALHGVDPDPEAVHAFDVALILHADHELNASTFAGRVAAATLADIYSAVVAAVCTLKGPLHGGANEQVFAMLERIGAPENAEASVRDLLAAGRKVPGFGHRVYRTDDPRAVILRELARQLGAARGEPHWYEISARIAETVKREKGLFPNVDFYSASTYHALGIPPDLFTPVFAISRMAGWTAHILEQYGNNRLIRPRAEYTGPHNLRYISLAERL